MGVDYYNCEKCNEIVSEYESYACEGNCGRFCNSCGVNGEDIDGWCCEKCVNEIKDFVIENKTITKKCNKIKKIMLKFNDEPDCLTELKNKQLFMNMCEWINILIKDVNKLEKILID